MKRFLSEWTHWQLAVSLGFVVLCALGATVVESDYFVQVMVLAAIYAAVGTAWAIAGGLSGLLLLGYISFFGLGAYIDGLLCDLAEDYGLEFVEWTQDGSQYRKDSAGAFAAAFERAYPEAA